MFAYIHWHSSHLSLLLSSSSLVHTLHSRPSGCINLPLLHASFSSFPLLVLVNTTPLFCSLPISFQPLLKSCTTSKIEVCPNSATSQSSSFAPTHPFPPVVSSNHLTIDFIMSEHFSSRSFTISQAQLQIDIILLRSASGSSLSSHNPVVGLPHVP